MTFISHTKNFEDIMLWRALRHVKHRFYLDVGTAGLDKHSMTKAFYDSGWGGINVEPNPVFYSQLQEQAEARAGMAEAQLADILNSKTWQLTAPLRWAIRQFRILQKKFGRAQ